jgi:hypothetical protein
MSFNAKNPYAKSSVRVYNANPQVVTDAATTLTLEGTPVVDTGCSLTLNAGGISVNKSGLYHLSADVTFTPAAAGTATIQLYKDGVPLPCALSQTTAVAATTFTTHIETDLCINTCCVNSPVITLVISGVAGTVNRLCAGVLKLA